MGSNRARLLCAVAGALGLAAVMTGGPAGVPPRAAEAVDQLRQGPRTGMAAAAILTARDQTGARRDFSSLRGTRGLIVMFSRSFDW